MIAEYKMAVGVFRLPYLRYQLESWANDLHLSTRPGEVKFSGSVPLVDGYLESKSRPII